MFDLAVLGLLRQFFHEYGEASLTRISMYFAVIEVCSVYPVAKILCKSIFERTQGLGRQFFGTDLHQKISGFHVLLLLFATDSIIGKPSASRLA